MAADCLFCKLISGELPAQLVARRDAVVAFRDKFPIAPVHVLVAPVEHIESAHALTAEYDALLAECFEVARSVAESEGIASAYRIATNIGEGGGQSIPHLHFHVVGGRQLGSVDSG